MLGAVPFFIVHVFHIHSDTLSGYLCWNIIRRSIKMSAFSEYFLFYVSHKSKNDISAPPGNLYCSTNSTKFNAGDKCFISTLYITMEKLYCVQTIVIFKIINEIKCVLYMCKYDYWIILIENNIHNYCESRNRSNRRNKL